MWPAANTFVRDDEQRFSSLFWNARPIRRRVSLLLPAAHHLASIYERVRLYLLVWSVKRAYQTEACECAREFEPHDPCVHCMSVYGLWPRSSRVRSFAVEIEIISAYLAHTSNVCSHTPSHSRSTPLWCVSSSKRIRNEESYRRN